MTAQAITTLLPLMSSSSSPLFAAVAVLGASMLATACWRLVVLSAASAIESCQPPEFPSSLPILGHYPRLLKEGHEFWARLA
ncbi:hypothetical protein Micbo1qcDRAFT_167034, partial [Microdochium bolleyi]